VAFGESILINKVTKSNEQSWDIAYTAHDKQLRAAISDSGTFLTAEENDMPCNLRSTLDLERYMERCAVKMV